MAEMHYYSVVIEFTSPWRRSQRRQIEETVGCVITLVETWIESQRSFALYEGQLPFYTLDDNETDALLHLLGQLTLRVPWDSAVGFDGFTHTLTLKRPMSHAEFQWWVEVPQGWESVGAVFDYVMALAKRHGFRPALCR